MALEEEEIPGAVPEQTQPDPADKPLTVDISDDDDDDGKPEQQSAPDQPKVRHKSDWRRMKEKYETDLAEVRRELAEMRGRVSQPQQPQYQPQQQGSADPVEAEITSLARHQDFMLKAINAGTLGDADQAQAIEEWRKLDRKRRALEYQKDVGTRPDMQPVQNEDQMIGQLIRMEFPHVFQDEEMLHRAQAEMAGLMKRGRAKSLATAREACQRVSKRVPGAGVFAVPPPSDAERSRYSSVSSRAGANGASGNQFVPNKLQLEAARAYTSHISEMSDAERVKKWVRDVGKPSGLV